MSSGPISATAAEIRDVLDGQPCDVVMTALALVTAEALASFGTVPGKTIDDAMALFTKQVRALYAELAA